MMLRFLEAMRAHERRSRAGAGLADGPAGALRRRARRRSRSASSTWSSIAESALAPVVPEAKPGFTRYIRREPLGVVLTIAPWNYPYLTAVNTDRARADGRQRGPPQGRLADDPGRRPLPAGDGPRRLAQGPVPAHSCSTIDDTERIICPAAWSTTSASPARSRADGRSSGPRPAPSRRSGWSSAARTRPMCAPTPISTHAIENTGRRRVLQFGAELLRHRAHLRARRASTTGSSTASSRSTRQYVLDDPLDQKTTLGPMAQTRFAEAVRKQTAEALAKGASALIDPKAFKRAKTARPGWRRRC